MFGRKKRSDKEKYEKESLESLERTPAPIKEQSFKTETKELQEPDSQSIEEKAPEEQAPETAKDEAPEKQAPETAKDEEPEEQAPEAAKDEEPEEQVPETAKDKEPEKLEEKESERPEERGRFKWAKSLLLVILVLAASVIMTFGYSLWSEYSNRVSRDGKEVTVEIPKGSSAEQMAVILQDCGVIRYRLSFLAKVYFSEYRGRLRYGTFQLNDGSCLDDIIRQLATGGAVKDELSFTVPEGYSIEMIAERLEKEDVMSSQEFLTAVNAAAADFLYAGELPEKEQVFYQMQGYLFPDTYQISENMTGDELVKKMLDEFLNKFDTKRQEQAKKLGLTVEEVLIRASLVQKETDKTQEYAMIAGVINNRLAKNMKLQFDSTTVYAMTNGIFGVARVTYDDLKLESPYNTYYVKGLPPGPICNPGLSAIDGVLNPEKHDYLYFQMDQTKNDGSNLFFETYEEHAAASATTEAAEQTTASENDTDKKKTK